MGLYNRGSSKDVSVMAKMIVDEEAAAISKVLEVGEQNSESNGITESCTNIDGNKPSSFSMEITSTNSHNEDGKVNILFVILGTAVAALGGILFGYDMAVVSGSLPELKTTFSLTSTQQEMIVSFLYLGGGIGAAVGGYLCDIMGRRFMILVTDLIFFIGALLLSTAPNLSFILVGRVVVGFAVSIANIANVAYLHEIAPPKYRGAMVSCNEASISLGLLLGYFLDYCLEDNSNSWRTMFGVGGAVATVQMCGMMFMPESPVWLESRGRGAKAAQIRQFIHGISPVVEVKTVQSDQQFCGDETPTDISDTTPIQSFAAMMSSLIFLITSHYRQATIAVFLATAQQFCGHTNVVGFAQEIFAEAGLGIQASTLSTLYLGIVKLLVTVFVICMVEYLGRRSLLLFGISTISISLSLLIIALHNDALDENGLFAIIGAMGVVAGYAASFGPLTWLLTSEMFPANIRGRALGCTTVVSYLGASLVSYTFLSLQVVLNSAWGPFAIYLAVSVMSFAFAYLAIPDTGGKSVEEIEVEMGRMWWWEFDETAPDRRMPSMVEVTTIEGRPVSLD